MFFKPSLFLSVGLFLASENFPTTAVALLDIDDPDNVYNWPAEDGPHEATWLQWPHNFGWDPQHVNRYEESWIQLAKALHTGEQVRIIVYNRQEKRRVRNLLKGKSFDMSKIEFYNYPTDDVWIRDNGPIFVFNKQGKMLVEDWKFNGWGGKADSWFDDYIPKDVAWEMYLDEEHVPMVNEGGSVEVDGKGTMMAKRSSILNRNRNPGVSQAEAEKYFHRYFGVTNFVWLDGTPGLEITDDHIDGTARFANGDTIVTLNRDDFINKSEYDVLARAKDAFGKSYKIVHLPITAYKVPKAREYGVYTNYYVGNEVVAFPIFNDPNDDDALEVIRQVYPNKKIVPIDFTELYADGGVAHCVTMQQPAKA